MKRTLAWLTAVWVAGGASGAAAFQFDVWRSGMKVERAVEVGKENGVSLAAEAGGLPFVGKKETDDLQDRVEYRGSTKLMGYPAKVHFSFAPESKVLHTVRVTITLPIAADKADLDVLADAIAKQLDAKYKDLGDVSPDSLLGQLAAKVRDVRRRAWKGGGDLVTLEAYDKLMGDELIVTYVDEKLAEKAKVEDRRIREKRLERSGGGDKGKF